MKILLSIFALASFLLAVDINKATVEELATLNGIGQKKAEAIVEHRTKNNCFNSVDELKEVKGIGDAILSKNKDKITISPCKQK